MDGVVVGVVVGVGVVVVVGVGVVVVVGVGVGVGVVVVSGAEPLRQSVGKFTVVVTATRRLLWVSDSQTPGCCLAMLFHVTLQLPPLLPSSFSPR